MKKIISLLMALIFVFSMATPSFAAVAANDTAVQSSVVNDDEGIAGANNLLGQVVEIVNSIWTRIVDFFKSIFGFGFRPGTYNVIYYTDESKTMIYEKVPTLEGDPITPIAIPTRVGYTFKSWQPALPKTMPGEDVEVYATWSLKTVTISFVSGVEGVKPADIKTTYGSTVTLPTLDEVDNKVLIGWEKPSGDVIAMPGGTIQATDDIVLTAKWGVKATTITFNPNGGYWNENPANTAPYKITQSVGQKVTAPADPTRAGYKFEGWDGVIPSNQPSADVKFTAVWTPLDVKTTWVSKGVTLGTQTTKAGSNLSPKVSPVPDAGFRFVGWRSSTDGITYDDFPIATPSVATTFTAVFEAIEYNYTFLAENGSTIASGKELCGNNINVPDAPSKTGYTFVGWVDATGTVKIAAGAATAKMQAGDATYTAKYTANVHKITWNANSGTIDGKASKVEEVAYGTAIEAPVAVNTGYNLDGWTPAVPATMPDNDLSFTAVWAPAGDTPYTVETYKMGTDGNYVKTTETKYGTTGATVTTASAAIEGFTFNATQSVLSANVAANGSTVLKVYYDRNKYDLYAKDDATATAVKVGSYYYEETITYPAAPTKEGNTFAGWAAKPAGDKMPAGIVTIVGTWTVNKYTITFIANDTEYQKLTFDYGTEIIAPADPVLAGMYFEGWSPALPATMPAADMTVTAVFGVASTHKVTFHANGKGGFKIVEPNGNDTLTVTSTFYVKRGDSIPCPDGLVSDPGYRFIGWATYSETGYTEDSVLFTGVEDAPKMTYAQDIFFYAVYVTPSCEVKFMVDGVEVEELTKIIEYAKPVVPSKVTVEEKLGYDFSGWELYSVNGTLIERDKNGNITNLPKDVKVAAEGTWLVGDNEYTVVYAGEYVPHKHNVVFHASVKSFVDESETIDGYWYKLDDDGKVTEEKEVIKTVETEYGAKIDAPNAPNAPYGMKFLGWATDNNPATTDVVAIDVLREKDENLETNTAYTADKPYDYYAVYAVDVYEIQFVEYDDTKPADYTVFSKRFKYDEAVNVSSYTSHVPDRTGYSVNENDPVKPAIPTAINNETIAEYNKNLNYEITYKEDTYVDKYEEKINYYVGVLVFDVKYTCNDYKVYFSGCDYETMEIPYGTILSTKIKNPTFDGRTFQYWYKLDENGQEVKVNLATETMPANAITLYAKWTNDACTIAFVDTDGTALYDQDGNVIPQINGHYGDAIAAPKAPVKTGYTFAGWDIEKFPTKLEKPYLEIKAKWNVNSYVVKYDTNGGQPEKIDSVTVAYDTQIILPANPTKTGYDFQGWSYVEDGEKTPVPKDAKTLDMPACDITLKAEWGDPLPYTITFVTGNGVTVNPITAPYGTPINVSTEWTGHTYTWSPALPETMPDKDMTVTAIWTCKDDDTHEVYFHPVNTPDDPETAKDESYAIKVIFDCADNGGAPVVVPTEADFAKIGFTVATGKKIGGWKDADGKAVDFKTALSLASNGKHYYVSEYVDSVYTLTFDTDGGSDVPSATYKYNDAIVEPADPTKAGYTFAGWLNEKGNLVDFESAKMPAADTTFTAKWDVNKYDAIWDIDGVKTVVSYDFGAVITPIASPAKEGYVFTGWSGYTAGMTMPVDGITFVATWKPNAWKATFDPNGGAFKDAALGSLPFTKTFNYGTAINAPELADRTGYKFVGWVDKASNQPMPANMPNKDVIFYALWAGVDGTEYTVNIYTMDTLGEYVLTGSTVMTGVTGAVVDLSATEADEGFKVAGKSNLTGVIKADGSLVLNVYFERLKYTFKTVVDGKTVVEEKRYFGTGIGDLEIPASTIDTVYTGWSWSVNGIDITKPAIMPAADLTATATATPKLYTVTFIGAGSGFTTISAKYNEVIDLAKLETPTATGKTFKWWSMEDKGSAVTTVTVTGNVSIYAVWEAIMYNASFYSEDGAEHYATKQIAYGTVITYTPPARDGYTFDRWVLEGEVSATTMPAKDVKLYARWTANS